MIAVLDRVCNVTYPNQGLLELVPTNGQPADTAGENSSPGGTRHKRHCRHAWCCAVRLRILTAAAERCWWAAASPTSLTWLPHSRASSRSAVEPPPHCLRLLLCALVRDGTYAAETSAYTLLINFAGKKSCCSHVCYTLRFLRRM